MDELREVARYAVGSAQDVLPVFEQVRPEGARPRAAIDAAKHAAAAAAAADDPAVGLRRVEEEAQRATPTLVDILRRYPPAPTGKSRVSILMKHLDTTLRTR
ncbi:MAG: hypothetical protein QG671_1048 [Actinomycetota bacterium]|nr:hypothetical protein [Actinomycetota bacterium]